MVTLCVVLGMRQGIKICFFRGGVSKIAYQQSVRGLRSDF